MWRLIDYWLIINIPSLCYKSLNRPHCTETLEPVSSFFTPLIASQIGRYTVFIFKRLKSWSISNVQHFQSAKKLTFQTRSQISIDLKFHHPCHISVCRIYCDTVKSQINPYIFIRPLWNRPISTTLKPIPELLYKVPRCYTVLFTCKLLVL